MLRVKLNFLIKSNLPEKFSFFSEPEKESLRSLFWQMTSYFDSSLKSENVLH